MSPEVLEYPLDTVDWLIANETEGSALSGKEEPRSIVETLRTLWPHLQVVLTMGENGVLVSAGNEIQHVPAVRIQPVDTTAAGDTFIGYFMAGIIEGQNPLEAAKRAAHAAAISVSRPGAADSIPFLRELK